MSDQERAVGGGDSGEDEEVRVGPSASAKFGAAFAKILGKRDAAEASGHLGGLERLEVRTQKAVRVDKKDDAPAQAQARDAKLRRMLLRRRGHAKPSRRGDDPEADALERRLLVTATRGVVRLFNAVRKEQKDIEEEKGIKPKLKAVGKLGFLDMLKAGTTGAAAAAAGAPAAAKGGRASLQMKPLAAAAAGGGGGGSGGAWEVLREDFLTGAGRHHGLKDWDKGLPDQPEVEDQASLRDAAGRTDDASDDSDF